jgi:hypothetical protein
MTPDTPLKSPCSAVELAGCANLAIPDESRIGGGDPVDLSAGSRGFDVTVRPPTIEPESPDGRRESHLSGFRT